MKIKFLKAHFYRFTVSDEKVEKYIQSIYDKYGEGNILWQDIIAGDSLDGVIVCHTVNITGPNVPHIEN